MPKGFVYILECSDGSYYTGSTINFEQRIAEHQEGKGANHTKKRLPVQLVYLEEFQRIDDAFVREKQIQGWNRFKKEALIKKNFDALPKLSMAYRDRDNLKSGFENLSHQTTNYNSISVPEALEGTSHQIEKVFKSNGKLLLTGEYLVLNGAKSLALPTKYGQSLSIIKNENNSISWKSFDENNAIWFQDEFLINDILSESFISENEISQRLIDILRSVTILNPDFLKHSKGFTVKTTQDFNRSWGLGTSSTLINNIANWVNVDAYKLLELTFGGSGYDIACAQNDTAITYQLLGKKPAVTLVNFTPSFKDNIYFVYLNQKQNSRHGIAAYRSFKGDLKTPISKINKMTEAIISCNDLREFKTLITEHEQTISDIINQPTVKEKLFKDFNGAVKSLGAWGGDFILATSEDNPSAYFKAKGYNTIIPYSDMIKI